MSAPNFFTSTHQVVRSLAQEIVEKTGQAVEAAVRLKKLQARAAWSHWKIIECGPAAYCLVKINNELDRYPSYGTIDIETVEKFLAAREKEPCF